MPWRCQSIQLNVALYLDTIVVLQYKPWKSCGNFSATLSSVMMGSTIETITEALIIGCPINGLLRS